MQGKAFAGTGGEYFDLATKSLDVGGNERIQAGVGIEIAVSAAVAAERDVEIQAKRLHKMSITLEFFFRF